MKKCILICGQTASGKSKLSVRLAQIINGAIINADSRQIVRDFPILSDIPIKEEMGGIPHFLYGYKDIGDKQSYHDWSLSAMKIIEHLCQSDIVPILVGGSGFYIRNLVYGFLDIPSRDCDIGFFTAEEKLKLLEQHGQTLRPNDPYRLDRDVRVLLTTSKPMSWWEKQPLVRLLQDYKLVTVYIEPEKEVIAQKCISRIDRMFPSVLDEVRGFMRKNQGLVYKVIGLNQIAHYLEGEEDEKTLETVKSSILRDTLSYAKRQRTWFRNKMQFDLVMKEADLEKILSHLESINI